MPGFAARPPRRAGWLPLRGRFGEGGLELVAEAGELGQVGVVGEGLPQAGLIVPELAFGDGEVLPGCRSLGVVSAGQAVESIEHGPRAVSVAGKHGAAVVAPSRNASGARAGRAPGRTSTRERCRGGQGESRGSCPEGCSDAWPGLQHVLLRIRLVADSDGIAGMGGQRRPVLCEIGDALGS